jgi:hypothetical protein
MSLPKLGAHTNRGYTLLGRTLCSVAFKFCTGIGGSFLGKALKKASEGRLVQNSQNRKLPRVKW